MTAPIRGPELLAPAGTLKGLTYALAYGADAVYAGLPRYSLRVRNNDFDAARLAAGIAAVHAQGRRLYLACNLMPHGAKLRGAWARKRQGAGSPGAWSKHSARSARHA